MEYQYNIIHIDWYEQWHRCKYQLSTVSRSREGGPCDVTGGGARRRDVWAPAGPGAQPARTSV